MRIAARRLTFTGLVLVFVALFLLALPARAQDDDRPRNLPAGPPPLPDTSSPQATKPFVQRSIRVLHSYDGENIFDGFGWVGMDLGDLTGDGVSDYLITAPFYPAFTTQQGRVYVYSGADGALLHVHTGAAGERLGYSAAAAGDVNADGVLDYVLSAPRTIFAPAAGRVTVYSGADHSVIREWSGDDGVAFGSWVDGAGDLNGDGHDDVIVGAQFQGATPGVLPPDGPGRVYAFSGAGGEVLWIRDGFSAGDRLGGGVGRISDVNGDGVPDVVAAAAGADNGNGRGYVFSGADGSLIHTLAPAAPYTSSTTYGTFFARGGGDIDADGTEDVYIGDYNGVNGDGRVYIYSGADGSLIRQFDADQPADGVGPGRGVPDINGDGHDDLVIASWTSNSAVEFGGKVGVYSGADGSLLHLATGSVQLDALGVDALPLGDLNGDGLPEYMLTAVGLDFFGLDVGHVYVVTFNTPPGVLPGTQ